MKRGNENGLDAVGWSILGALQENARISFAALGRRVGLTAPAAAERVRQMEDAGVIRGYRAEVGLERLGLAVTAVIRVSAPEEKCPALQAWIRPERAVTTTSTIVGLPAGLGRISTFSISLTERPRSSSSRWKAGQFWGRYPYVISWLLRSTGCVGAVHRFPAKHPARVLHVAVAVAQVRHHVEDVEAQRRRRLDAGLDHAHDVALAAPHRDVARGGGPVLGLHAADAQTDDGHLVGVGVVAPEGLAPDLGRAVQPARPQRRLVGERRDLPGLGIAAGHEVAQRRLLLPAADRRAAAGEDDALDARDARGLEDVEGADDVGADQHLRRVPVARGGGQVHDGVDVLEGRLDRGEVAEVGLVRLDAGDGPAVQRAQRVLALDVFPQRAADEPAEPGDQQSAGAQPSSSRFRPKSSGTGGPQR